MSYKKKSVHLEDSIHKKLKKRAFDKDSTIREELNKILKKEFKVDKNEKK